MSCEKWCWSNIPPSDLKWVSIFCRAHRLKRQLRKASKSELHFEQITFACFHTTAQYLLIGMHIGAQSAEPDHDVLCVRRSLVFVSSLFCKKLLGRLRLIVIMINDAAMHSSVAGPRIRRVHSGPATMYAAVAAENS